MTAETIVGTQRTFMCGACGATRTARYRHVRRADLICSRCGRSQRHERVTDGPSSDPREQVNAEMSAEAASHWRRGPLPVLRPPWRDRHAVNLTAVEMSTYDGGYYLLAGPAHSCEKVGVILTVREQYRIEYRQKHPLHWRRALAQVLRAERDADV